MEAKTVEKVLRRVIEACFYGFLFVAIVGVLLVAGGAAVLILAALCWYAAFEAEHVAANIAGYVGLAFCACCGAYAVLWLRRQGIKAKVKSFGADIYDWLRGRD